MSEVGIVNIGAVAAPEPSPSPRAPAAIMNPLLDRPILPTLLRLTTPNIIALSAGTCVAVAETTYIGLLGTEALAAIALVFPFVMLTMTMSGGAMGGGVSSAIARALGASDVGKASRLAGHALLIGGCFGLVFTVGMLVFGPMLLAALGGRGGVLTQATSYTTIFFSAATVPWFMNTFASILRGTGNMKLPSMVILGAAVCQMALGGVLGLGLGPVPRFGMPGVAVGTVTAYSVGLSVMAWYVLSGRARVNPISRGFRFERAMFFDIFKVGAIACFSPLQSVLTIIIFTHMLAHFGNEVLAGYGIGGRLEFMLTSLAFAVGIASVPMIGMAIGAGRPERARGVAWVVAALCFVTIGIIGAGLALRPDLWIDLFTNDPAVREAGRLYLSTAAPMYAFLCLATATYFSSQGAAKVLGPVLAQSARLVMICGGGWWLLSQNAPVMSFYWLTALSMIGLGLLSAVTVLGTKWRSPSAASPAS